MDYLILSGVFLLGTIVGSFINVLAERLPKEQNPWRGRSHCDHCKKILAAKDLVPVLSFLFLKGRCRYCHKKLSVQYPLVELLTGVMFVFLYIYVMLQSYQGSISNDLAMYASLLIIFCSLWVIFISDLKYQIIPDEMSLMLIAGSLFYHVAAKASIWSLAQHVLVGVVVTGLFYGLYELTKRRGMGLGDVKLVFGLGFWLGFPHIVVGLYTAFLTGGAISLILLLTKQKRLGQRIAFGPFLILGAVVSYFFGQRLFTWFFGTLF